MSKRPSSSSGPVSKVQRVDGTESSEPAAGDREASSSITKGGFDSEIFTLVVGSGEEKKTFKVHASYLSQSPVFDRMCNGQFEESHTFQICLPEDNPEAIEDLIEYFYTGNFRDYGTVPSDGDTGTATDQLAEIYCVAEKYGLRDLKFLVVKKLVSLTDVKNRTTEFLSVARKIYACTPDSDDVYRNFFKGQAMKMEKPAILSEADRQSLNECVSAGSTLALDIVGFVASNHDATVERLEATLTQKSEMAREQKVKYDKDLKKKQKEVSKLETELAIMTQQMERYRDRLNRK
ncbi:MAG: hypothetical protein Q9226_006481 [Calogaya cf. arnoldii]